MPCFFGFLKKFLFRGPPNPFPYYNKKIFFFPRGHSGGNYLFWGGADSPPNVIVFLLKGIWAITFTVFSPLSAKILGFSGSQPFPRLIIWGPNNFFISLLPGAQWALPGKAGGGSTRFFLAGGGGSPHFWDYGDQKTQLWDFFVWEDIKGGGGGKVVSPPTFFNGGGSPPHTGIFQTVKGETI